MAQNVNRKAHQVNIDFAPDGMIIGVRSRSFIYGGSIALGLLVRFAKWGGTTATRVSTAGIVPAVFFLYMA